MFLGYNPVVYLCETHKAFLIILSQNSLHSTTKTINMLYNFYFVVAYVISSGPPQ